jgi:ATP-dependent helicase/DNAse subunit B
MDKYTATWVSHSSIGDYLKCPRLYYLRAMYKDPKTGHKITLMSPALALGQAVHEVVESLYSLPVESRLDNSLFEKLELAWQKVAGKKGGFRSSEEEEKYRLRASNMLQKIIENPGPIARKAIRIPQELPHYWLEEEKGIILCGKIDWLEYIEESDSVKIIDFKTGKHEEDGKSLQLPIYALLVKNCQNRQCVGAAYWYLDRDGEMVEMGLPDLEDAHRRVSEIAEKIALARKLDHLKCKSGNGCNFCAPLEKIVRGEAEFVGLSNYNQDIYI